MNSAATNTAEARRARIAPTYEKFGWIFIVCATGKSAEEMLSLSRIAAAESAR